MKSPTEIRKDIVSAMWGYTTIHPKSSPEFHRYLEQLLTEDRKEILKEILELAEKEDNYNDVIQAITNFKIK